MNAIEISSLRKTYDTGEEALKGIFKPLNLPPTILTLEFLCLITFLFSLNHISLVI